MALETADSADLTRSELLKGARVLLAEDDLRVRDIVAMILRKKGARVCEAADGVEALKALRNAQRGGTPFEVAFLDLMMPRINGVEVLRSLRNNPLLHHTPVIIVSAVKDNRVHQQCSQLGITDYIVKPPRMVEILEAARKGVAEAHLTALAPPVEAPAVETELPAAVEAQPSPPPAVPDATTTADPKPVATDGDEERTGIGFPLRFADIPRGDSYALRAACYRCPFDQTTFTAPYLMSNALVPDEQDHCQVGLFEGGNKKDYVEFPLIEVIVCPSCLYASDRMGFHRLPHAHTGAQNLERSKVMPMKKWEHVFFPTTEDVRQCFSENLKARLTLAFEAGDTGHALFRIDRGDPVVPRRHEDALVSYQLALASARTILPFCKGEAESRMRQRCVELYLKEAHCFMLMIRLGTDATGELRIRRRQTLSLAHEMTNSIDVNGFQVLADRLLCMARRFYLTDMLFELGGSDNDRDALDPLRYKAVADMREILRDLRTRKKDGDARMLEGYLKPIEERMCDLADSVDIIDA